MIIKPLHLFDHYLPPTQNWAYNLIRHLPEVDNHIAARHYLKQNFYHSSFRFFDNYLDGVTRYDHSLNWNTLSSWVSKAWIKALPFWMGNETSWLLKYIAKHKVDILHAHFAPTALFYKSLKRKTNLPFVVSFYGYDYEKALYDRPEFREQYRALFKLADAFVCEGPHGAALLKNMGCPEEKIHIVPLGIEVKKTPYCQRKKEAGELKLIQVASFTEKKGHIYSVQAFSAALKDCPNMSLTLVGDERQSGVKQEVNQFISDNGLEGKVSILDWIDYEKLYRFLQQFHVFIHPSVYTEDRDCEGGAPVIILAAQSTGMPIISSKHCDIPFIVEEGKTALLAPEKNIKGLAEAIQFFYSLPFAEYEPWALNARHFIEEGFDIGRSANNLKMVYESLA